MIGSLKVVQTRCRDPYRNLALEEYLLESVEPGQCVLYLWQNQNTVVIGRNQNPWKECKTALLEQEGGKLARRLSGGGAVFHDLGNLNFTFLVPQEDYDVPRQMEVIRRAAQSFGLRAEVSGRNDILAEGRKFSGNAFYKNGRQAYHHGTLLVAADLEKLTRYLTPSKAKLQAKGVDSVRSRVVNLKELNPEITIDSLKEALISAFSEVYGLPVQRLEDAPDSDSIRRMTERNGSWEWNYGRKMPFSWEWEHRFSWGGVQIGLEVESGIIRRAKVWSDAMDYRLSQQLEDRLAGQRFRREDLAKAAPAEEQAGECWQKLLEEME